MTKLFSESTRNHRGSLNLELTLIVTLVVIVCAAGAVTLGNSIAKRDAETEIVGGYLVPPDTYIPPIGGTPTDTTPPVTVATVNSSYAGYSTVTLAARDGVTGSGVLNTKYILDGAGGTQTYGSTFSVTGPIQHSIEFWSTDVAGNIESPHKRVKFYVNTADTTAPVTVATITLGWVGYPMVSLAATDAGSGVATTYRKDGANGIYTPYTTEFQISSVGPHTLYYYSTDRAGNIEVEKTMSILVNPAAPVFTVTSTSAWHSEGHYENGVWHSEGHYENGTYHSQGYWTDE